MAKPKITVVYRFEMCKDANGEWRYRFVDRHVKEPHTEETQG